LETKNIPRNSLTSFECKSKGKNVLVVKGFSEIGLTNEDVNNDNAIMISFFI
jgi:hypothetical protein